MAGKLQRAEHVVGIGHGNGWHPRAGGQLDQFLHRHRAFQQRMFGMAAQMDESGRLTSFYPSNRAADAKERAIFQQNRKVL
jgi:hypothetical protein